VWRIIYGLVLTAIGLALCCTIIGIPLGVLIIIFAAKPLADKLKVRPKEER
jgi:uncharacterized membrane protein YccF (DUF307 family)